MRTIKLSKGFKMVLVVVRHKGGEVLTISEYSSLDSAKKVYKADKSLDFDSLVFIEADDYL